MVHETGEGTAKLLHSIANGEIDSREDTSVSAKRALVQVAKTPRCSQTWKETAEALVRTQTLLARRRNGARLWVV